MDVDVDLTLTLAVVIVVMVMQQMVMIGFFSLNKRPVAVSAPAGHTGWQLKSKKRSWVYIIGGSVSTNLEMKNSLSSIFFAAKDQSYLEQNSGQHCPCWQSLFKSGEDRNADQHQHDQ